MIEEEYEIIDKSRSICPICIDKQGKYKINLKCGHTIHPLCLKQWIRDKTHIDIECPSCKKILNKNKNILCYICGNNNNQYITLIDDKCVCLDCI